MKKLISNPLTTEVAADIRTATNDSIEKLKPFHVSLTDKEKIGVRTMAEGREGVVRLLCKIALQHTDSLPRNEDPQEMVTLLKSYEDGGQSLQAEKQLTEMLEDTQTATGIDLMALYDRYNKHLQAARTGNTALDAAMREMDEYNSRFGGSGGNEDTPPTS
ncbi:hypothetical protein [Ferruginibacter albus]|uniref:hypothetical protein n=1 Tax=Ferruginibacter albus TaxID=2875540 RepID=UPI001CC528DC|nr:hypothetical protein [Ferruginibacter albus]UAY51880.1 hypothetical protein K9M53_14970 [Ferruginibacter albus]